MIVEGSGNARMDADDDGNSLMIGAYERQEPQGSVVLGWELASTGRSKKGGGEC